MKVLGIGYGRHLFDQQNFEFKRLERCAGEVDSFDQIIFAKQSVGLKKLEAGNNFTLHPTNSSSRLHLLFDAVELGTNLIKEKNIEVITTQDPFEAGLVGLLLKRRFPHLTLQVQEHGDVLSSPHWRQEKLSNRLRYYFAKYVLKRADIIRVVSERTKKHLQSFLGADKTIKKLAVVIDVDSFVSPTHKGSKETDNTFTFLTAARFVPQKNFPLMLKAFKTVKATMPNVRLRIFGDGPLRPAVLSLIKKLGLEDSVEVQNWTDDLAGEMQKADAYLLSSNYEGWGRVLIEAMMQNLPTATTDVGCAGEVLQDKTHGLVVPVGDTKAFAVAMQRIINDKQLYQTIRQNLANLDVSTIPGTNLETYAVDWANTMRK